MQIELLEFEHRVNLRKYQFHFRKGRLNVIVCKSDFNRSLPAEAVQALLFVPDVGESGLIASGRLKATINGRPLVVQRDFPTGSIDAPSGSDGGARDEARPLPGEATIGVGSDIFRSVFMSPTENGLLFLDPSYLERVLSQSNRNNLEAEAAIRCIDDQLNNFSFKGNSHQIDELISGLTKGRDLLLDRLGQLEKERSQLAAKLTELSHLEKEMERLVRIIRTNRYLRLSGEIEECNFKVRKAQERLFYESELRRELLELGDLETFPVSSVWAVEELWGQRTARVTDLRRLSDEIVALQGDADEQLGAESPGAFTAEDAQTIYGLSRSLQSLQFEVEEMQLKRAQEMRRVKEIGIDFDKVARVRSLLLSMEPQDLADSNSLFTAHKEGKEHVNEVVKVMTRIETQRSDLDSEVLRADESAKAWLRLIASGVGVLVLLFVGTFLPNPIPKPHISEIRTALEAGIVFTFLSAIGVLVIMRRSRKDLAERIKALEKEYAQQSELERTSSSRNTEIQSRLDKIAAGYNLKSGVELSKHIQSYATHAVHLRDLDLLDQVLSSREAQLKKLSGDIEEIFAKAGRQSSPITAESTAALADEINRHLNRRHSAERSKLLPHRKSEQKFLEGEIKDLDSQLRDVFYKAKLSSPEDVETAYLEFQEKSVKYRRWEAIRAELARAEQDRAVDLMHGDLPAMITQLKSRSDDLASQLEDLLESNPAIAAMTLEQAREFASDLDSPTARARLEVLRSQHSDLLVSVRVESRNLDEFLPKTQHELETIERDLAYIQHDRKALNLARTMLSKLSSAGRKAWSSELSRAGMSMIEGSSLPFSRVDWDERLMVKPLIKDSEEPVRDIAGELSAALKGQLNLITRLSAAQLISSSISLPMILDEPFAESDDEGFLAGMRLILSRILPERQVIVVTCHQVRHQWLLGQLTPQEKQLLHFTKAG